METAPCTVAALVSFSHGSMRGLRLRAACPGEDTRVVLYPLRTLAAPRASRGRRTGLRSGDATGAVSSTDVMDRRAPDLDRATQRQVRSVRSRRRESLRPPVLLGTSLRSGSRRANTRPRPGLPKDLRQPRAPYAALPKRARARGMGTRGDNGGLAVPRQEYSGSSHRKVRS